MYLIPTDFNGYTFSKTSFKYFSTIYLYLTKHESELTIHISYSPSTSFFKVHFGMYQIHINFDMF